jgi:hypothetical protein
MTLRAPALALLKAMVLLAAIAVPLEIMSYFAGQSLVSRFLLYDPPPPGDYARYLEDRHPVLGWPARGRPDLDRAGSRLVPRFPDPATPSCAALFGDSYTWGHGVEPEHAYGNVLSGLMGCRAANYGIAGYGTDQAYLRYLSLAEEQAPIVILGFYSDNIIRNVNQNRGFLTNQALLLKPRFVLAADGLKLIPLPALSEPEYLALAARGHELLPYDYFAPGGPGGARSFRFPFTLAALGAVRHYRFRAGLAGRPSYAEFYDPQHPSQALQVTEAIMEAFAAEARRRGQKPMVLLIPDEKDLRWLRRHGTLPYAELAARLRNSGIAVPAIAEQLDRDLDGADPCQLYSPCGGGHFAAQAYKRLAEIVFAALADLGWLKRAAEPGF